MRTISFIMLLMFGGVAQAATIETIDFDNTPPTNFGLSIYQEDGFTLTSNVPDGTLIDQNDVVRANLGIFSGGTSSQSMFWGENGTTSIISFANDGGNQFDLLSLDTSSLYQLNGQLNLTGTLAAGGTVSQALVLTDAISTYNITGMDNLSGLDISFDGATYFAPFDLDNVQFSVVPVPAAVWLFASSLVGLMGWARRRRNV